MDQAASLEFGEMNVEGGAAHLAVGCKERLLVATTGLAVVAICKMP